MSRFFAGRSGLNNRLRATSVASCLILCGIFCASAVTAGAGVVTSTFDTDLEGWTAVGFNIDTSLGAILSGTVLTQVNNPDDIVHDSGGNLNPLFTGNGGGFARFTDMVEDPGSFASAPSAFLGDLSAFLGGTFSYDHRLFDEGSNNADDPVQPYVMVFISGNPNNLNAYGMVFDGPIKGAADTDWVNLSTTLDGTGLIALTDLDLGVFDPARAGQTINSESGGRLQTTATLEEVMSDVTQVLVSFEMVDNNSTQMSEAGGIDNPTLRMIPEPTTCALLGLAGLALLSRRKRRAQD